MKASFKGCIVACARQETDGGNAQVTVALDTRGKWAPFLGVHTISGGDLPAQLVAQLIVSPRVADRLVFGASVTIEVEIKDGES